MMGEVEDEEYMSRYKVPIEWFVRFFDCNLRQAFQVPDGYLAHMVLKRVGFIRILVEGEFQGEIDVAKEVHEAQIRREEEASSDEMDSDSHSPSCSDSSSSSDSSSDE